MIILRNALNLVCCFALLSSCAMDIEKKDYDRAATYIEPLHLQQKNKNQKALG